MEEVEAEEEEGRGGTGEEEKTGYERRRRRHHHRRSTGDVLSSSRDKKTSKSTFNKFESTPNLKLYDIKERDSKEYPTINIPEENSARGAENEEMSVFERHTLDTLDTGGPKTMSVTTVPEYISLEELLSGLLRIPGHKRKYPYKYQQQEQLRFVTESRQVPTDYLNYQQSVYGTAKQDVSSLGGSEKTSSSTESTSSKNKSLKKTYPEVPRMSSTTDVNRQKLIPFPDVTSISGRSMTVYGTRSLTASNPKVTPVPAVAAPSSGDELKNKMVRVKIRRRRSSNKVKEKMDVSGDLQ